MGDGYYLDIVLFALVAAFLVLRLRSVLGRRDGFQGKAEDRMPFPPKGDRAAEPGTAADRGDPTSDTPPPLRDALSIAPASLEAGLTQIRVADPRFDPREVVTGSRKAFEWILQAFVNGDTNSLQPLLSSDVFNNFEQTIKDRQRAGEKLETTLVGITSAEITEAYMAGRTAHVTVKFVSQQISAVRDAEGAVIEGDPNAVADVTDYWTFARDTRSNDPNWTLVATGSPE
jgi:Uncharacterized protein conserved in bacteria